jgi:hypothetical protein
MIFGGCLWPAISHDANMLCGVFAFLRPPRNRRQLGCCAPLAKAGYLKG